MANKKANRVRRKKDADPEVNALIQDYPHLTVDHIIPKQYGGELDIKNIQMLTWNRNQEKGGKFYWKHDYLPTCQPYGVHHL